MNFSVNDLNSEYVMGSDITEMDSKLKAEGKTGIVWDPSGTMEDQSVSNDVSTLPDVKDILAPIAVMLEYMAEDSVMQLKYKDDNEYVLHMEEKFSDFSSKYYSLFREVISGNDISPLFNMLGGIERAKSGQLTREELDKEVGDEINRRHVYPQISKEKLYGENANSVGKPNKKKKKKKNKNKKK